MSALRIKILMFFWYKLAFSNNFLTVNSKLIKITYLKGLFTNYITLEGGGENKECDIIYFG